MSDGQSSTKFAEPLGGRWSLAMPEKIGLRHWKRGLNGYYIRSVVCMVEYRTYDKETETEIAVRSESWTKRWTAAQTRNGFTESTWAKLHFMHVWIRVNRMLVQRTLTVQFIKDWRWNRFVNHVITAFRFWRTRFRDRTNPPSRSVNSILFRYLAISLSLSLSSLLSLFFTRWKNRSLIQWSHRGSKSWRAIREKWKKPRRNFVERRRRWKMWKP